jgi:hypothetical protein
VTSPFPPGLRQRLRSRRPMTRHLPQQQPASPCAFCFQHCHIPQSKAACVQGPMSILAPLTRGVWLRCRKWCRLRVKRSNVVHFAANTDLQEVQICYNTWHHIDIVVYQFLLDGAYDLRSGGPRVCCSAARTNACASSARGQAKIIGGSAGRCPEI